MRKQKSLSVFSWSRQVNPHSLATFLYSELVVIFSFPTVSRVIISRLLRQSREAAVSPTFVCQSVVFRVSRNRDGAPCPTSPPRQHWGQGESSGVSTGHSAYITSTLGPFVLSDPGLLSCFQTGRNTSCGGNVQGDTVTGHVCECVSLCVCV